MSGVGIEPPESGLAA